MLERLFPPRPAVAAGRALFAAALAQARRPAFYEQGLATDTPEGRFEFYVLHVVLVLHRLKGEGAEASETGQAMFDAFVKNLDDGLRDMGVGDLSVGKKMRKLGEAVYGRIRSYDAALAALPDSGPMRALLARTVLEGRPSDQADAAAGALAGYVADAVEGLAALPLARVLGADLDWPAAAPSAAAVREAAHGL